MSRRSNITPEPWRIGNSYLFSSRKPPTRHAGDDISGYEPLANFAQNQEFNQYNLVKGQPKWFKGLFTFVGIAAVIGAIHNLVITISAREAARARIIYHPVHGMFNQHDYLYLTNNLHVYIGFLVATVLIIGTVFGVKWHAKRGRKEYSEIAEAARRAKTSNI